MKLKLTLLTMLLMLVLAIDVHAGGDHDHGSHEDSMPVEEISPNAVNVGNAICPVSGKIISEVDDGKGIQMEYEGKVYNVCCKMCAKDFKKDPEKFIKIIENNLAKGKDPGRDDESDHDEDDPKDHEGTPEKDEGHAHGDHAH